MTKKKPEAAAERFAHHMKRIEAALETLKALHGATAPKQIDWGHVGSAEYIADRLDEIVAFAAPTEGGTYGYTTDQRGKRIKVFIPTE